MIKTLQETCIEVTDVTEHYPMDKVHYQLADEVRRLQEIVGKHKIICNCKSCFECGWNGALEAINNSKIVQNFVKDLKK
jgi:hypothetical protein